MSDKLQQLFYPESRFGGFTDLDGTVIFYGRVHAILRDSMTILDVGCGRGAYAEDGVLARKRLRILKGKCKKVIGIDVDEAAEKNPFLDEFRKMDGPDWPVESGEVDLCLVDNVLEHIQNVDIFFKECGRVLKPGGYLCIRTPNLCNYISLISKIVPNRFHARVLSRAQSLRREEDVFPTYYRANTIWSLRKLMNSHGFEHVVYGYEAEPSYLSFSKFFYRLGIIHQRCSPKWMKASLFAFGKKLTSGIHESFG